MPTLRITSSNANELMFADPNAFYDTVAIKNVTQPKRAGSRTVFNSMSSINMQRLVDLPARAGCTDKCAVPDQERTALRFSLSGSTASKTAKLKLIADFQVVLALVADDLASGFRPSTDLVITLD